VSITSVPFEQIKYVTRLKSNEQTDSRSHGVHPEVIYVDEIEALWKKTIYWAAVNAFQSQT
jgi:hypothetical protein